MRDSSCIDAKEIFKCQYTKLRMWLNNNCYRLQGYITYNYNLYIIYNLVMCHHCVSENSTCSNCLQETNQETKAINKDVNCRLIYNGKYLQMA